MLGKYRGRMHGGDGEVADGFLVGRDSFYCAPLLVLRPSADINHSLRLEELKVIRPLFLRVPGAGILDRYCQRNRHL